eukprot:319679_1
MDLYDHLHIEERIRYTYLVWLRNKSNGQHHRNMNDVCSPESQAMNMKCTLGAAAKGFYVACDFKPNRSFGVVTRSKYLHHSIALLLTMDANHVIDHKQPSH